MNIFKYTFVLMLFLLKPCDGFAADLSELHVGQVVLIGGHSFRKEKIIEITRGLVLMTVGYGTESEQQHDSYDSPDLIKVYHPVKTLSSKSIFDELIGSEGTTYKVGQGVLIDYIGTSEETITDLTSDGMVNTTAGDGLDYVPLEDIKPYHPAD